MEKNGVAMLSMAAATVSSRTDAALSTAYDDTAMISHSRNNSYDNVNPPKPKLVLPELTPDVQRDLEKTSRLSNAHLPLSISKRKEWLKYPLERISQPHPNDVLCGRGGGSNNHPGNEAFRVLVNDVKIMYVNCSKREKPLIARRIVEAVRNQTPPGRFLQKDNETGLWNDIGDGRAREKTSQALREGAPVIRNMIDKQPSTEPCSASKKQKVSGSPLVVLESKETHKKDENQTVVDSVRSKEAKMYHDYANQLSLQATKERAGPVPPSNMHQSPYDSVCPSRMPQFHSNLHNTLPVYPHPSSNEELGRYTGGFALPPHMQFSQHRRRATMDYAPSHMRHHVPDSIPYKTVRALLLGHLDPVQLAYNILPPEDAAAVARLHINKNPSSTNSNPAENQHQQSFDQQPAGTLSNFSSNPLPLVAVVSDGSSSPSMCQSMKEENQSSDDSSRQSSIQTKPLLPKKKRKFIE